MVENEIDKLTLYDFREQKWEDILSSLSEMVKAKEVLLGLGLPMLENVLSRVSVIFDKAKSLRENNFIDIIDKENIRFLFADAIKYVANNPNDKEVVGLVSVQLFLVSAVIGNLPDVNFKPYNLEEFKEVILGTASYYDVTIFLQTLRQMIISAEEDERALWLLNSLAPLSEEDETPFYGWDEALVFSMVLQVLWKNFAYFGQKGQQFLLQNYFYQAIVCGVPVRYWVEQFFSVIDDQETINQACMAFVKSLENNQEKVPVNLDNMTENPLSVIIKDYTTKMFGSQEKIEIFTQEKFIEEMYGKQDDSYFFKDWIRQVLGIVLKLRKKDWS